MLEAMALFLFHKGIQIIHVKLIQLTYRVPPSTPPPSGNIFIPLPKSPNYEWVVSQMSVRRPSAQNFNFPQT